jgi:hypothetical protein
MAPCSASELARERPRAHARGVIAARHEENAVAPCPCAGGALATAGAIRRGHTRGDAAHYRTSRTLPARATPVTTLPPFTAACAVWPSLPSVSALPSVLTEKPWPA